MNVDVKPAGACKVNVVVTADATETGKEYRNVLNMFIREGNIKGFRKGKAPLDMIKKTFGAEISKEAESRLCRKLYKDALDQAGVKMVNLLDLKDVHFFPETGLRFTMVVDIEPDFKLPKYTGIAVKPVEPTVTEEQVDEYVERMRSAFAKFEKAADDYAVRRNDLVCIDFKGTVDGKPVKEVAPEADQIAEGSDFWVEVDAAQFIPEVVEALVGMKAGEEKTVKFKFPKPYPVEALEGCKAVYEFKVSAVRERMVPSDEDLCKHLKTENIEDFRKDVRVRMQEGAIEQEMRRRRQVVTDHLLKKASFDLPESELSEATNNVLEQMMRDAKYRGMKTEDMTARKDEIVALATQSAASQVRMKYIIREIAAQEGITAAKEEVDSKIEAMALDYNIDEGEIRKRLAENNTESVISEQVVFDKTIDFLLAQAK